MHRVDEIDLVALTEANKRWRRALGLASDPIRVEDVGDGRILLRAEAVTGLVRVGSTDIEIAPKFLSTVEGSTGGSHAPGNSRTSPTSSPTTPHLHGCCGGQRTALLRS